MPQRRINSTENNISNIESDSVVIQEANLGVFLHSLSKPVIVLLFL